MSVSGAHEKSSHNLGNAASLKENQGSSQGRIYSLESKKEWIAKICKVSWYILFKSLSYSCMAARALNQEGWKRLSPPSVLTDEELERQHREEVEFIALQFEELKKVSDKITLQPKKNSHLWRPRTGQSQKLDLRHLNKVLKVDVENKMVHVQGGTTMNDLVDATLKYKALPQVVLELRGITVAGAISGLGVESSSFKYGLFHHSVVEIEVLTGAGEIKICTRDNENSDLFFALPNSFGTLGYILSAKIQLIPALPYVELKNRQFDDFDTYFKELKRLCAEQKHDFIDGVIFSKKEMVITTGDFTDRQGATSDYRKDVYYKSLQEKNNDRLKVEDYIKERWDADSFWTTEGTIFQSPFFRGWLKPLLRSDRLERVGKELKEMNAHIVEPFSNTSDQPLKERMIQDVGIPMEKGAEFSKWFFNEIWTEDGGESPISPVFICPIVNPEPDQYYPLWNFQFEEFAFDFGFFKSKKISPDLEEGHYNKLVEKKLLELGGKKSLYSRTYYDRETFEKLYYGEGAYRELKDKYDPAHVFPDLYEKCVENH